MTKTRVGGGPSRGRGGGRTGVRGRGAAAGRQTGTLGLGGPRVGGGGKPPMRTPAARKVAVAPAKAPKTPAAAKTNGKGKKKRPRKKGAVALMEYKPVELPVTLTEIRDLDFVPPKSLANAVANVSVDEKVATRGDERVFWNIANSLLVLPETHDNPDDEATQYWQFIRRVERVLQPRRLKNSHCYETEYGIWISSIVRYKNLGMKNATIEANDEKVFWKQKNGCPESIMLDINLAMKECSKPVCVLVGAQQWQEDFGHCVPVVIVRSPDKKRRLLVKDVFEPTSEKSRVKSLVYQLAAALNIWTVEYCPMLPMETHVLRSECIREAYKVAADILDGFFFWERYNLAGILRKYSTKSFKLIE